MSGQKLGANDVDVMMDGFLVNTESVSLTIDDKTAAAMTRGLPDGWVSGDVSAAGEMEVDSDNLDLILQAAQTAGSFMALPAFDVMFHANTNSRKLRIEAFGCKLRIGELLNASQATTEKLKHKLPFDVTGADFIRINGIPYAETRGATFSAMVAI